jgi:hypothetical protein
MAKNAYYFPHDCNASRDPKILQMCSVYKSEGYGWYWMLVEQMREQDNYKLPIAGKYAIDAYAMRMYCDGNALHKFIDDCVNEFQLFKKDDDYLWSESLIRRMANFDIRSVKARESALNRWHKQPQEMPTQSVGNAIAMLPQCDSNAKRVKESKVKESKVNNINNNGHKEIYGEFNNILLTKEEYEKLSQRFGKEITEQKIQKLSGAIASKGYKYKSHYATILTWDRNDQKRINDGTVKVNSQSDGSEKDNSGINKYTGGRYGGLVQH